MAPDGAPNSPGRVYCGRGAGYIDSSHHRSGPLEIRPLRRAGGGDDRSAIQAAGPIQACGVGGEGPLRTRRARDNLADKNKAPAGIGRPELNTSETIRVLVGEYDDHP